MVPIILLISIVVILGTVVHLFWFWFSLAFKCWLPTQSANPFSHALHVDNAVLIVGIAILM